MGQLRGVATLNQTELDMEKIGFFSMLSKAYGAIGSIFNMIQITAEAGEKGAKALDAKADELLQTIEMEKQQNLAKLRAQFEAWEAAEAAKKQQQ